jgi:hypothetical protein
MPITKTEEFNKSLEVQQNLVAGYDQVAQLATIEDLMYQQAPWTTVLRALILMSLTSGGIKQKPLEAFKRDFLQVSWLVILSPQLMGSRYTDITTSPYSSPFKILTSYLVRRQPPLIHSHHCVNL